MTHISHYFNAVKQLLKSKPTSLKEMYNCLSSLQCPDDETESVVNGILNDKIQDLIPKDGILVETLYNQLKKMVPDIEDSYIKKIFHAMCTKQRIHIIDENKFLLLKPSIPNQPLKIE